MEGGEQEEEVSEEVGSEQNEVADSQQGQLGLTAEEYEETITLLQQQNQQLQERLNYVFVVDGLNEGPQPDQLDVPDNEDRASYMGMLVSDNSDLSEDGHGRVGSFGSANSGNVLREQGPVDSLVNAPPAESPLDSGRDLMIPEQPCRGWSFDSGVSCQGSREPHGPNIASPCRGLDQASLGYITLPSMLGIVLFLAGLLLLACPMGNAAELHFCSQYMGTTWWRHPEYYRYADSTTEDIWKVTDGTVAEVKLKRFPVQEMMQPVWPAVVCHCFSWTMQHYRGLFGKQWFSQYKMHPLEITELECLRMSQWHESPQGTLQWDGTTWTTTVQEWRPEEGSYWGCCHWAKHTQKQCLLYNTTVQPTMAGGIQSPHTPMLEACHGLNCSESGFRIPCNATKGLCHLPDKRVLIWKPETESSSQAHQCLLPTTTPETGIAYVVQHSFSTVYVGGKETQLQRGFVWFSPKGDATPVPFLMGENPLTGVEEMELCGRNETIRGHRLLMEPHMVQVLAIAPNNGTQVKRVELFLLWKYHQMAQSQKVWDSGWLAEQNPTASQRALQGWSNVTALYQHPFIGTQQCHTRKGVRFKVLPQQWPSNYQTGFLRLPIEVNLPEGCFYGFWDSHTDLVYPQPDPLQDQLAHNLQQTKWAVPLYYLPRFGEGLTFTLLGTSRLPTYLVSEYHPHSGHLTWPLLTKMAEESFLTFRAVLLPGQGRYPMHIELLWLLAVLIYGTLLIFVAHCMPTWKWLRWLNPGRLLWKFVKRRWRLYRIQAHLNRRQQRARSHSPRERLAPEPGSSRHRFLLGDELKCSRSLFKQSRNGHESPPIYWSRQNGIQVVRQLTSGETAEPGYTAACYIRIGTYKLRALLDTGATISLLKKQLAEEMKLTIAAATSIAGATGLSGHEVPILGQVISSLKLGSRCLVDQSLYLVEDLGTFDVILGLDLIRQLGPLLLHVDKGILKLLAKTPKTDGECIRLGEDTWPVRLPETVDLPPRTEVVISGQADTAPQNLDQAFTAAVHFDKTDGVWVAHALVRPRKGFVPVRLLNQSLEKVCLYQGTTLGWLSPMGQLAQVATMRTFPADQSASGPQMGDPLESLDLNNMELTQAQQKQLQGLLKQYKDVFSQHQQDIGCIPGVEHQIDTQGQAPIKQRPYRTEFANREVIREQIRDMEKAKVIRPSCSPWASPVVLVPKKDGTLRFCVDFCKVNAITKKDSFPLPLMSEVLDSLGNAKYFSSMDLTSGYWNIKIREEDVPKTAFVTFEGMYKFLRVPFGLSTAPATFQRAMQHALSGLTPHLALVYLDDVLVFSDTFEQHLKDLQAVLERFRKYNLRLKAKKCSFCSSELEYLGHIITPKGLKPDPKKTRAIMEFPAPTDITALRRFLGMAGFYRRLITGYAQVARPLYDLFKKKQIFQWKEAHQCALERLKQLLSSAPVLAYPRFDRPFIFETDASVMGLGCVLSQEDDQGRLCPVAFASRSLTGAERNYTITELECLAVTWSLKMFRPYAYGWPCKVITDHEALRWLLSQATPSGRLNRWSLALQEYQLEVVYRPGRKNEKADALSRAPLVAVMNGPQDICKEQQKDPCFGS